MRYWGGKKKLAPKSTQSHLSSCIHSMRCHPSEPFPPHTNSHFLLSSAWFDCCNSFALAHSFTFEHPLTVLLNTRRAKQMQLHVCAEKQLYYYLFALAVFVIPQIFHVYNTIFLSFVTSSLHYVHIYMTQLYVHCSS